MCTVVSYLMPTSLGFENWMFFSRLPIPKFHCGWNNWQPFLLCESWRRPSRSKRPVFYSSCCVFCSYNWLSFICQRNNEPLRTASCLFFTGKCSWWWCPILLEVIWVIWIWSTSITIFCHHSNNRQILETVRLTFTVNVDIINHHMTPSMGDIHCEILTFCMPGIMFHLKRSLVNPFFVWRLFFNILWVSSA